MSSWLDTETQSLLHGSPPDKLAPPEAAGFTLVAISKGDSNNPRLVRAMERILGCSPSAAFRMLTRPLPIVVKTGLSHAYASLGQFELISCDAISVILLDDVVEEATPEYLDDLYAQLLQSPEFEVVSLHIDSIPTTERGREYIDQFLGSDQSWQFYELKLTRKKARIMGHWGAKIGAHVTVRG